MQAKGDCGNKPKLHQVTLTEKEKKEKKKKTLGETRLSQVTSSPLAKTVCYKNFPKKFVEAPCLRTTALNCNIIHND